METKVCNTCNEDLPLESYAKCSQNKDGRQWRCRLCWKKKRSVVKESIREYQLQHKFGITSSDYTRMWEDQGGVCKICKQPEPVKGRSLAVDHCHTTGKVRGLLCGLCNGGLGKFRDNPQLLKEAINYLEISKYGAK